MVKEKRSQKREIEDFIDLREFRRSVNNYNKNINKIITPTKLANSVVLALLVVAFISLAFIIKPDITGLITYEKTYSLPLNLHFNESTTKEIKLAHIPGSLKFSGAVTGEGTARVYLEDGDKRLLVFNSSAPETEEAGLTEITGHVTEEPQEFGYGEEPAEKTIDINLEYLSGTNFDIDDDGYATKNGIVDFTVQNTGFNWQADYTKVCTKWEIYSEEEGKVTSVCYGADSCCAFIDLVPASSSWDDPMQVYAGRYGATSNNKISARVLYIDYNIGEETYEDNVFSEYATLDARFTKPETTSFEDACVDTCSIDVKEKTIKLVIELEDAELNLTEITYTAVKTNRTDNESFEEEVPAENLTGNYTIQFLAEMGKPVKWMKKIKLDNATENVSIKVPWQATNFTIRKIENNISSDVDPGRIEVRYYNEANNSEYDGYLKEMDVLEQEITKLILELNEAKGTKREKEVRLELIKAQARKEVLMEIIKTLPQINASATNETEIIISNETTTDYEVEYYTDAPTVEEQIISDRVKQVIISSELPYENIFVYTNLTPESEKEIIRVYWIINGTKQLFWNVSYNDTNNNSLVDRIEWVVPHLSEQIFEISLEILTVQSYPELNGNWTVAFETFGTANLTITATNGTTYSEVYDDDNSTKDDLEVLEVKCENETLFDKYAQYSADNAYFILANGSLIQLNETYSQSLNISSIFFENYSCDNKTSYHTVKVLTTGKHTQEFKFGNQTAYAFNDVSVVQRIIIAPNPQGFGSNVTFWINATDPDSDVINVTLEIKPPGGARENFSMNNDSIEEIWNYNNYTNFINGTYNVTFYVNDSAKNVVINTSSFNMYVNLTMQVRTLKESYSKAEVVNLTDPPDGVIGRILRGEER